LKQTSLLSFKTAVCKIAAQKNCPVARPRTAHEAGTDVTILKIFSVKNLAKLFLLKIVIITSTPGRNYFTVSVTRGRCYDRKFLRFLPILSEKLAFFYKNQCYDQIFAKTSSSLSKKRHFVANFYGENI
jgi:hypothetical protein